MPSTALMRIDVGASTGTSDVSRVDGTISTLITLTYTGAGGVTFLYRFWDVQNSSTPSITNSTTSVATFTTTSSYGATYGIELLVDGSVTSRRTLKVPTQRLGLTIPAYAEKSDDAASLQNNGAGEITLSTDNAGSNYRGWGPTTVSHMLASEKFLGLMSVSLNQSIAGTTETLLGGLYLPSGTINLMTAEMGCAANTDTATLRLYRRSNNTLIASAAVTGTLSTGISSLNISVPATEFYELRGLCGTPNGIATFVSALVDVK